MNITKRTRAERKAARRELFNRLDGLQKSKSLEIERQRKIRQAYEQAHPITCGLIPCVDYVAPR